MSRLPNPVCGHGLDRPAHGFPLFYGTRRKDRVITGDIWAYLAHLARTTLAGKAGRQAQAFLEQAHDFYRAASAEAHAARPLLYYYSYLNLAKVFLLLKGISLDPKLMHGIQDPQVNAKTRLCFKTQEVRVAAGVSNQVFPQLLKALDPCTSYSGRTYRVLDLLAGLPHVHRTYALQTSTPESLCPVEGVLVVKNGREVRCRVCVPSKVRGAQLNALRAAERSVFGSLFHRVAGSDAEAKSYESVTSAVYGGRRGIDKAAGELAATLRKCGLLTMLSTQGYRMYLSGKSPSDTMPQLAASYAIMYYFGSVTRYKPYDFDKIVTRYDWLVNDFIDTDPEQFLYLLASTISQTEVVYPYAVRTI